MLLLIKYFSILIAYSIHHHSLHPQSKTRCNIVHALAALVICSLKMIPTEAMPEKRRIEVVRVVYAMPIQSKRVRCPYWQKLSRKMPRWRLCELNQGQQNSSYQKRTRQILVSLCKKLPNMRTQYFNSVVFQQKRKMRP